MVKTNICESLIVLAEIFWDTTENVKKHPKITILDVVDKSHKKWKNAFFSFEMIALSFQARI